MPVPHGGEAFTSWVARSADTHKITIDQMLAYLGLPFSLPVVRNGVELTAEHLESVTAATGLDEQRVRAMLLTAQGSGTGPRLLSWNWNRSRHRTPWPLRPTGSAVCPECVAQEPTIWKRDWRFLTVVACPEHRLYLHSWCPACRAPIQIGGQSRYLSTCGGPSAEFMRRRSPDGRWHRPNSRPRGRRASGCGAQWAELPRYPVTSDRVLALQEVLTGRLGAADLSPGYGHDLHMALRLAVQLGVVDMLGPDVDPPVWLAYSLFQPVRDQVARMAGVEAEFQYSSMYRLQPGPMLMAAAMSILDALWDDDSQPIQAAHYIVEYYTNRLATPAFRLLERALVENYVFGRAAVQAIPGLRVLDMEPQVGWRDELLFDEDEGVARQFADIELLVALGEWAIAVTSPAIVPPSVWENSDSADGTAPADAGTTGRPVVLAEDDGTPQATETDRLPWGWVDRPRQRWELRRRNLLTRPVSTTSLSGRATPW
ncbi:TniQ family protein [Saccharothrix lopnurensis]|uniref:TniQ family protein n=1 Tax=Saccharothrix lopnurensis TaxID=1670621 RepID=A0ABW1NZI2_9PSEU